MTRFTMVALGGALGAVLRYAVSLLPYRGGFPLLTLFTNAAGAVLIGFLAETAALHGLSENALLFAKTGLCGGFTTFSTFSLESWNLYRAGRGTAAAVYILLSVGLCLAGIALGTLLARKCWQGTVS